MPFNPNISTGCFEMVITYCFYVIFQECQESTKCYRPSLNTLSHRSRRPAAVLVQSPIPQAIEKWHEDVPFTDLGPVNTNSIGPRMDSLTNPHLRDEPAAIIAFPAKLRLNPLSNPLPAVRVSPAACRRGHGGAGVCPEPPPACAAGVDGAARNSHVPPLSAPVRPPA